MKAGLSDADVVIVGAGSAGCVLAARLSEDLDLRVALLEAGPEDRNPWIHVPAGYAKTIGDTRIDWSFQTMPDATLGGRRLVWPRGKVLGGTSSLNGMLYLRGHRDDYESWAAAGNTGWGWADVLPYFRKSEDQARGADEAHATGGPLRVSDIPSNALSDAFIEAAGQAGVIANPDFNGGTQEGAGYFQMTTRNGRRDSAARAYLKQARKRPNLHVITGAQVLRVLFDGRRAAGVEYLQGGVKKMLRAGREVILCAGTIQSPQLLQFSGVGNPALLRRHGIDIVSPLAAVGRNLQDHLQVRLPYRCAKSVTINDIFHNKLRLAWEVSRYAMLRKGFFSVGVYRAGAFLRSADHVLRPDVQVHFGELSFDRFGEPPHPFPGVTFSLCNLRPHSRGTIEIASADPLGAPKIDFNGLAHEEDCRTMVRAVHWARRLARQPAFGAYIQGELRPGASVVNDTEILQFVRDSAVTIFHPVGTCRMGVDDAAVVDPRLRVRGVEGLRVVDGSIMPTIVSGNTNAPIIMIAEKAADMLREDLSPLSGWSHHGTEK